MYLLYQESIFVGISSLRGLDVVRPATIAQSIKRPSPSSSGSSSLVYQPLAPPLDAGTCTDYYVLMNPRDKGVSQVRESFVYVTIVFELQLFS